jgi:hypothetical protein
VLSKMADATSSASSATEMLMKVTVIEIAVLAIVHPATLTAEQMRMGPSMVSPPPSPPVLPEPFSSPSPTGMPQGDVPSSPPPSPPQTGGTVSMHRRRSFVETAHTRHARMVVRTDERGHRHAAVRT